MLMKKGMLQKNITQLLIYKDRKLLLFNKLLIVYTYVVKLPLRREHTRPFQESRRTTNVIIKRHAGSIKGIGDVLFLKLDIKHSFLYHFAIYITQIFSYEYVVIKMLNELLKIAFI